MPLTLTPVSFGDAVNHARVFDVFGEHGFDAFAFDLADDGSDLFGGRLGFAAHALRGDELDIVAFAHVGERVVSGQDFALGGGNGVKRSLSDRCAVFFSCTW